MNKENIKSKVSVDPYHLSGINIVTGKTEFVDDTIKPSGMLFVKCLPSPYAHAKILKINTSKAEQFPGVVKVLTWRDIPGKNQIGHMVQDQPLLPQDEVVHIGQTVALVVATSKKIAQYALKLIVVEYAELPVILTIKDALKQHALYVPPRVIERGDIKAGFANSDYVLEGEVTIGTQEHVYFETNSCRVIPGDAGNFTVYSSTQHTAEVQHLVALILGLQSKDVTVDVKRLGGGFGYKEVGAATWACYAALAAYVTKKPVEIKLTQAEDMLWTGKRHPFLGQYKIGFSKEGKILAYEVTLSSNGGAFVDISVPIFERAMYHATHAYYIPNAKITGQGLRTNLPPNTAFRGFGAPQGIFVIENAIEKIAEKLKVAALQIREMNLYQDGETTSFGEPVYELCHRDFLTRLKTKVNYEDLLQATDEFNRSNQYLKRGIAVLPLKFGISFTFTPLNQATALIWVYTDGSISMSHGGIEMGQEVNTKVAQVVARELGVSLSRIRMESSNTQRNGNASPTAASTGSDLNGFAAQDAAKQIKARLTNVAVELLKEQIKLSSGPSCNLADLVCDRPVPDALVFAEDKIYDPRLPEIKLDFAVVVNHAYMQRVNLGAQGFYKTPYIFFDGAKMQGCPFLYFAYGVALVQSEVDILTGANRLLRVHIIHDVASSLNKSVDQGQITGAFMQGYGLVTMEEMNFNAKGKYTAASLSTYKIPCIRDLPAIFDIELVERELKHASVMGSKAVGEPPLIYGLAGYFAIKNAIQSINPDKSVELSVPATPEAIVMAVEKQL